MAAEKRKHTVLRVIATLLSIVLIALFGLVAVLTITEYHPAPSEVIEASGTATEQLTTDQEVKLLTWNIGYGALGDNADFFMDGGTHVNTASAERVAHNMDSVLENIGKVDPDIALFQEVDTDSTRNAHINQVQQISDALGNMESYFAYNYKTIMVPLGIPPYGQVESGIQTLTSFPAAETTRIQLPLSYSWPVSTAQLKRCQLVSRIPVAGSEKSLVLINEHPDAYTNEENHAAQLAEIRELIESEAKAGNWVVAGGDWNHSFSSVDLSDYPVLNEDNWQPGYLDVKSFSDGWQFVMDNSVPTSRLLNHPLVDDEGNAIDEPVQLYMIDGFIVSENVEVRSVETIDLGFHASDHNPVTMEIVLKGE